MLPKEKAEELIEKFLPNMYCYMGSGMLSDHYDLKVATENAKECALIAAAEVRESFNEFMDSRRNFRHQLDNDAIDFWDSVKIEIEKL
jgi:hypothetical protein